MTFTFQILLIIMAVIGFLGAVAKAEDPAALESMKALASVTVVAIVAFVVTLVI